MTTVEQIYKDIEITFSIHDPVRKYFESRKQEWLQKEQAQIVLAHEQGRSDKHTDGKPPVMGSLVKSLNWIDSPEKRAGDIYKVMSRADVPMPHTVGNACIEITEQTYPYKYYEAKLWCFNRGTYMAEGKSVDEAKSNAFKWWSDFVCGFLNCP